MMAPPMQMAIFIWVLLLNKILKDMITRFQQMNGKDSIYVPGMGLSWLTDRMENRRAV